MITFYAEFPVKTTVPFSSVNECFYSFFSYMKSTRYPFCYISSVMNLHLIFQLESEEIKRRPCSENHDWLLLQSMAKEPGLHLFALSSFSYASFFCDSNEFQA